MNIIDGKYSHYCGTFRATVERLSVDNATCNVSSQLASGVYEASYDSNVFLRQVGGSSVSIDEANAFFVPGPSSHMFAVSGSDDDYLAIIASRTDGGESTIWIQKR